MSHEIISRVVSWFLGVVLRAGFMNKEVTELKKKKNDNA